MFALLGVSITKAAFSIHKEQVIVFQVDLEAVAVNAMK